MNPKDRTPNGSGGIPAGTTTATAAAAAKASPSMSEAERWRERGNDHFKSGRYKEAAACYSSSLAVAPTCVAYANRAMACLKLGHLAAAEDDCTAALALDASYVKAYLRRATARKQLGKLGEAVEDFEAALRYEPGNKAAADDRRDCIRAWRAAQGVSAPIAEPVSVEIVDKAKPGTAGGGFLLNQVSTKRLDASAARKRGPSVALVQEADANDDEELPPVPAQPAAVRARQLPASAEEPQPMQIDAQQPQAQPVPSPDAVGRDAPLLPSAVPAASQMVPTPQLKAPRTGIEFEKTWKGLKADLDLQAAYVQLIDPAQLPVLLKQALTPPLLYALQLTLLGPLLRASTTKAVSLLGALPKVPRFGMNVLSLSAAQKSELRAAWEAAAASLEGTGEAAEALHQLKTEYKI